MSSNCKVVVPCNDSSIAENAAKISGVSSVIAAKSDIFSSYDAKGWTEALASLVSEGTVICAASAQSKDLAARIAANREISVIQDVVSIEEEIFPHRFILEKPFKQYLLIVMWLYLFALMCLTHLETMEQQLYQ